MTSWQVHGGGDTASRVGVLKTKGLSKEKISVYLRLLKNNNNNKKKPSRK